MMTKDCLDRDALIEDIEMAIKNWDERSQFTLAGVKNLSIGDLDTLKIYAEEYNGFNLIEPAGNIREVLIRYNVIK